MSEKQEMIIHDMPDTFGGASGLDYTAAPVERLDKNVYAVAQISVDISSSVHSFVTQLQTCLKAAIDGIEDRSQSDAKKGVAMLLRGGTFNAKYGVGNIFNEIHGFQQIADIDVASYKLGDPSGGTPLLDCMVRDMEIESHFTSQMAAEDILGTAFLVWITDGEDTTSSNSVDDVKARLERLRADENIDQVTTLLVGINDNNPRIKKYLDDLHKKVGIDHYIPFDSIEADGGKAFTKLIAEASKSVSGSAGSGKAVDLTSVINDLNL